MTKKLEELQRKQASKHPVVVPETVSEVEEEHEQEKPETPQRKLPPMPASAVSGSGKKSGKTVCTISRQEFRDEASPVSVVIDGKAVEAEVKEFSTGSLGWYFNGKVTLEVGGKRVTVQVGMNLTIVGSKELPQD